MIEGMFRTFVAGGTIRTKRRVKLSGATVVEAGNTEAGIGVAEFAAASGAEVTVRTWGCGTLEATASGVITAGMRVYPAADGKVAGTAVSAGAIGNALEAATADGDIIEIVPALIGKLAS